MILERNNLFFVRPPHRPNQFLWHMTKHETSTFCFSAFRCWSCLLEVSLLIAFLIQLYAFIISFRIVHIIRIKHYRGITNRPHFQCISMPLILLLFVAVHTRRTTEALKHNVDCWKLFTNDHKWFQMISKHMRLPAVLRQANHNHQWLTPHGDAKWKYKRIFLNSFYRCADPETDDSCHIHW